MVPGGGEVAGTEVQDCEQPFGVRAAAQLPGAVGVDDGLIPLARHGGMPGGGEGVGALPFDGADE
jgi:hypothetical protein